MRGCRSRFSNQKVCAAEHATFFFFFLSYSSLSPIGDGRTISGRSGSVPRVPPARNPNGPRFLLLKLRLSTSPRCSFPCTRFGPVQRPTNKPQTVGGPVHCSGGRVQVSRSQTCPRNSDTIVKTRAISHMFMLSHGGILMYLNNSLTYGPMKKCMPASTFRSLPQPKKWLRHTLDDLIFRRTQSIRCFGEKKKNRVFIVAKFNYESPNPQSPFRCSSSGYYQR